MEIQLRDFMKLVTVGDYIKKVIQIVGEINVKVWAIVAGGHQMEVLHNWWILS